MTTHPRPINQSALKHSDIVIMAGLTQAPHVNPDGMLGELCMNVGKLIYWFFFFSIFDKFSK